MKTSTVTNLNLALNIASDNISAAILTAEQELAAMQNMITEFLEAAKLQQVRIARLKELNNVVIDMGRDDYEAPKEASIGSNFFRPKVGALP